MTLTPKTKHELSVQQYCAYLSTQLVDITPELWFEFTMDTQRLIHNYVTRSKQTGQNKPPDAYQHQQFLPPQQQVHQPHANFYPISSHITPPSTLTYTSLQTVPMTKHTGDTHEQYEPQTQCTNPNQSASYTSEGGTEMNIAQAMSYNLGLFY